MRKAFGHVSELLKGLAGRLHLPDAPSGCPKRSEGGSPATARRTCVRCTPYKCRLGGASKRLRRRQPPPPPVRYTGIAPPSPHLLNRGRVFYLRGGGMVSSVVTSGTRSGGRASQNRLGRASKRLRRRQPPPPPVRYTGIAYPSPALTEPGSSVFPTGRRDGVLRRDIRVPEAKRGRVPCRNKEEHRPSANKETKKLKHKSP